MCRYQRTCRSRHVRCTSAQGSLCSSNYSCHNPHANHWQSCRRHRNHSRRWRTTQPRPTWPRSRGWNRPTGATKHPNPLNWSRQSRVIHSPKPAPCRASTSRRERRRNTPQPAHARPFLREGPQPSSPPIKRPGWTAASGQHNGTRRMRTSKPTHSTEHGARPYGPPGRPS